MTARPPLRFSLGFAAAWAFTFALTAAESPSPTAEKCAERFAELLQDYPAPDLTAYRLDGHSHDPDAGAKDANFRFQGWLFLGRKAAAEQLVFKKASAALRSKTTFAADARNCFTPEFGLRLRNGQQELDLLVGLHCQAVEFHAGKASARYPLSDLGANTFRALFGELFAEREEKEAKPEMRTYDVSDLAKPEELGTFREELMRQVAQGTWKEEKERSIETSKGKLVIMQTAGVHALIDKYLSLQRKILNLATRLHEGQRGEGQPAWILETQKKLERKVAYTFKATRFSDALSYLDSMVSINIMTDPRIAGRLATKLTLSAKEEPAYRAYARLLEAAGLDAEYRAEGRAGTLFISTAEFLAADAAARTVAELLGAFKDAPPVACKVEAQEAPNEASAPEATHLARWKILVARDVLDGKTAEEVRTALTSAASYTDMGANCFEPGTGFRFKKDDKHLDIVICLKCHWAYFYLGEQRHYLGLSDKGVEALQDLCGKIFPEGGAAQ